MADQSNDQGTAADMSNLFWAVRIAAAEVNYVVDKIKEMKSSNPNLTVLDVGASLGYAAMAFACVIPDGKVTAIDLNKDKLTRGQALAESLSLKNLKYQQADAYKLPFEDGTFDITHCHQVLAFVKAPCDVLREMMRVTKPGGIVTARELDFKTMACWPESPGLIKFHAFSEEIITKHVEGSLTAGRQLLSWALKAGAERGQITLGYSTQFYSLPWEKNWWSRLFTVRLLV